MPKAFRLGPDQIRTLTSDPGGCIATDRIAVDGQPVGYCYRETPTDQFDSGWRFFAGDEAQDYLDDPAHLELYGLNTIANYDPGILLVLDASVGSAFERNPAGEFIPVEFDKRTGGQEP